MTTNKHFSEIKAMFESLVPLLKELNAKLDEVSAGHVRMRVPYHQSCVGDPTTGVVHTAYITTVLDTCFGAAVMAQLGEWTQIATVDLRVDFLGTSTPGADLLIEANCYRLKRNLAFIRGRAFHEDGDDDVASATGTFIVGQAGTGPLTSKSEARS